MIALDQYVSRQEAAAVRRLVSHALAHDWIISVNDGEEWTVKKSRDRNEILAALGTTDSDTLRFRDTEGESVGVIVLIYQGGNSPAEEVIHDYSDNEAMEYLVRRTFPA